MRGSGEVENIMYELIDNFLDKEELESVESVLLGNKFPWFLNPVIDKKVFSILTEIIYSFLILCILKII